MRETTIPRVLAVILLVVSLAMTIPLTRAVAAIFQGKEVASSAWLIPLVLLATGFGLIWFLGKKQIAMPLYTIAFALWLVAAGYYFFIW